MVEIDARGQKGNRVGPPSVRWCIPPQNARVGFTQESSRFKTPHVIGVHIEAKGLCLGRIYFSVICYCTSLRKADTRYFSKRLTRKMHREQFPDVKVNCYWNPTEYIDCSMIRMITIWKIERPTKHDPDPSLKGQGVRMTVRMFSTNPANCVLMLPRRSECRGTNTHFPFCVRLLHPNQA